MEVKYIFFLFFKKNYDLWKYLKLGFMEISKIFWLNFLKKLLGRNGVFCALANKVMMIID